MSDNEYEIPLQDQRVFGAGIKRQRVKFVPSSTTATALSAKPASTTQDVASRYLSLVLPFDAHQEQDKDVMTRCAPVESSDSICEVCKLPLSPSASSKHHTTLAHQVCLEHSHPPSHVDRGRKGLSILSSYGWDPDSRLGLGPSGQGMQYPIKTKPKDDRYGIGVVIPSDKELARRMEVKAREKAERRKLDAGQIRKREVEDKRKREKLQRDFYGRDDVERLLRGD